MPYDSPGTLVFYVKNLSEIPMGSHPTRHQTEVGYDKTAIFDQYLTIFRKLQDRDKVTIQRE